jgi:DNA (cytosine-5)-methyltransferase 1
MGYAYAGHKVVGVDLKPQPRYPFEFVLGDALQANVEGFDFIHASPPCQAYSSMTKRNGTQDNHPRLVEAVREKLIASGLPYVIENVVGAPLLEPVTLCGTMFGLRLRRHRLFEANFEIAQPECKHNSSPKDIEILNHGRKLSRFVPVYGSPSGKAPHMWEEAMGIGWMKPREMAEAIPPAFTQYIAQFIPLPYVR